MGGKQSTVGRTKSLDDSSVHLHSDNSVTSEEAILRRTLSEEEGSQRISKLQRAQRSKSTLVIVNRPSPESTSLRLEDDPLYKKLIELPAFVPLMHEVDTSSNIFGAKARALAEIRRKVEYTSFIHIVRLYEDRMKRHADSIGVEQGRLSKNIREVDYNTTSIFKTLTERQKKFAKHAEKFGRMSDITHTLSKCQMVLHDCKQMAQLLNELLPPEERLEPFVWISEDQDTQAVTK